MNVNFTFLISNRKNIYNKVRQNLFAYSGMPYISCGPSGPCVFGDRQQHALAYPGHMSETLRIYYSRHFQIKI